ncbi:MAG: enoyl-CoA hydratase/isomerase family protein [Candidatus Stahlbacteria bacterium]|nr:enoyl-CoA hydratase/isomerase family protein [Candidatus Stahlbacteria bacterium]
MSFETIVYTIKDRVARVMLNRPEVHNAFNDVMFRELIEVFKDIQDNKEVRSVVLTGAGKSYCAGADINWMRKVKDYTYEENYADTYKLSELLSLIYALPKPVIGRINGAAIGGGVGFVAICDIAIASKDALFGFSEVKLGLIPACISPYIIRKCSEGKVRELFLTGERISAERALAVGLVNRVVLPEALDSAVQELVNQLIDSGPNAMRVCKELLKEVSQMTLDEAKEYTTRVLAELRMSDETQEGMQAFLDKRKPKW